jgi:hypothetical protein
MYSNCIMQNKESLPEMEYIAIRENQRLELINERHAMPTRRK